MLAFTSVEESDGDNDEQNQKEFLLKRISTDDGPFFSNLRPDAS